MQGLQCLLLNPSNNQSMSNLKTTNNLPNCSAELEQLKREASTLRFEKNELQQTVSEMQRTQTTLVENHEKTLRTLRNEHQ